MTIQTKYYQFQNLHNDRLTIIVKGKKVTFKIYTDGNGFEFKVDKKEMEKLFKSNSSELHSRTPSEVRQ